MAANQGEKETEAAPPERPMECSGECRRPVHVIYTEAVGKNITRFAMCEECPVLRQKLRGGGLATPSKPGEVQTELVCGGCGLTMEEVRVGAHLGCPLCYDLFTEEIFHELGQLERLPPKYAMLKKWTPLHMGRTPGQPQEIDPSLKLLALQQTLHETLSREDYEQAAKLRDQIREIEEKSKKAKEKTNGGQSQ
jgi:protein arginine kinase activator